MGWNAGENEVGVTSQNSSDTQHVDYIKRNIEVCIKGFVCVVYVGGYVHVQKKHVLHTQSVHLHVHLVDQTRILSHYG